VLAAPDEAPSVQSGLVIPSLLVREYQTLKQSTYDRSGGDQSSRKIAPGSTQVFQSSGPGVITHIWFTRSLVGARIIPSWFFVCIGRVTPNLASSAYQHFFGLNLNRYFVYQCFSRCSSVKALNCYFAMLFHGPARITVTNRESASQRVLFEHRLSTRPHAARRRVVLPRNAPAGDSLIRRLHFFGRNTKWIFRESAITFSGSSR